MSPLLCSSLWAVRGGLCSSGWSTSSLPSLTLLVTVLFPHTFFFIVSAAICPFVLNTSTEAPPAGLLGSAVLCGGATVEPSRTGRALTEAAPAAPGTSCLTELVPVLRWLVLGAVPALLLNRLADLCG